MIAPDEIGVDTESTRDATRPADTSPTAGLEPLRVISMFAGIGGFDLGLERTGRFKTVAVAENDKHASTILALRFPDAPNLGDVTKAEYPDAEVICAGFPCQDISFAGAGAGLAGDRSGLFWEVVRAIRMVRPEYVILENVAALLSRGLDTVLWALAEVGYDTEWHCIPASAVGAPHRRDRIWIMAHARNDGYGADDRFGKDRRETGEASISQNERQRVRNVPRGSRPPLAGILTNLLADTEGNGQSIGRAGNEGRNADTQGFIGVRPESCGDSAGSGAGALADACCVDAQGFVAKASDPQEREEPSQRQIGPCHAGIGGFWAVEPAVGRVADGIPARVDRLRCLGNAVVPQVVEMIGNALLQSENLCGDEPSNRNSVTAANAFLSVDHEAK